MIAEKIRLRRNAASAREGPLMPDELKKAEMSWIRNARKDLKSRIKNGKFKTLSLVVDDRGGCQGWRKNRQSDRIIRRKTPSAASQGEQDIPVYHTQCAHPWASRSSDNDRKSQRKYYILKENKLSRTENLTLTCREIVYKAETVNGRPAGSPAAYHHKHRRSTTPCAITLIPIM